MRLHSSDFLSDQYKIMMTECKILYRNEDVLTQYSVLTKPFIKIYTTFHKIYISKYKKCVLGQKGKTTDSYVENNNFKK